MMYIHSFYLLLLFNFILFIHALTIPNQSSSIIRAPLIKKNQLSSKSSSLIKRESSSSVKLYNDNAFIYLINIGIGKKNTQYFTLGLDTGSVDCWIPSSKCPKDKCQLNTYDSKKSNTFEPLNKPFEIEYSRGEAEGDYIKETIIIGDIEIQHQQISIVNNLTDIELTPESSTDKDAPSLNGILGLGFPALISSSSFSESYKPIMKSMYEQDLIQKQLFSIYLNQKDALGYSGEILFGGIDHTKYKGELAYLPVVPLQTHVTKKNHEPIFAHWVLHGESISLITKSHHEKQEKKYPFDEKSLFVFDTGTSFTYFPKDIVDNIIKDILPPPSMNGGGKYETMDELGGGAYKIDCHYKSKDDLFIQLDLPIPSFKLKSSSSSSKKLVSIKIPISNLILQLEENVCAFGIVPNEEVEFDESYKSQMHIIGDTILRSLYLVFDMDHKQIGLAASKKAGSSVTVV